MKIMEENLGENFCNLEKYPWPRITIIKKKTGFMI